MHRHWAEFGPPAYLAVAAYLGFNRRKSANVVRLDAADELADFLAGMPGGARV